MNASVARLVARAQRPAAVGAATAVVTAVSNQPAAAGSGRLPPAGSAVGPAADPPRAVAARSDQSPVGPSSRPHVVGGAVRVAPPDREASASLETVGFVEPKPASPVLTEAKAPPPEGGSEVAPVRFGGLVESEPDVDGGRPATPIDSDDAGSVHGAPAFALDRAGADTVPFGAASDQPGPENHEHPEDVAATGQIEPAAPTDGPPARPDADLPASVEPVASRQSERLPPVVIDTIRVEVAGPTGPPADPFASLRHHAVGITRWGRR